MSVRPFLFGKLPAHGDFVARGLAREDHDAWDGWGSAVLAALRAAAGSAFDTAHLAAPPWRFVDSHSGRWRAGAVAPSVDGVGRRFLIALGVDGLEAFDAGACGLAFAAEAEALIYDALAERLDADAVLARAAERFAELHAATADAARALAAPPQAPGVWWTLGSAAFAPCALSTAEGPHDLFARTVIADAAPSELEDAR